VSRFENLLLRLRLGGRRLIAILLSGKKLRRKFLVECGVIHRQLTGLLVKRCVVEVFGDLVAVVPTSACV
jgi:hypothetical protein